MIRGVLLHWFHLLAILFLGYETHLKLTKAQFPLLNIQLSPFDVSFVSQVCLGKLEGFPKNNKLS